MITEELANFNADNEGTEFVQDFGSLTNTSDKIRRTQQPGRAAEKILKSKNVFLVRFIQMKVFHVTMNRCESLTMKKADGKNLIPLECDAGRETVTKTNKRELSQSLSKSKNDLTEACVLWADHKREDSLEKTVMPRGKKKAAEKEEEQIRDM